MICQHSPTPVAEMQRKQRQKVAPGGEFHAGNRRRMLDSAMMTDEDTEQLRSKLRAVRDAKLNAWTVSPELATLLCLPPDEGPHSRMLDLLNQIILISALILSATLGIGMDPKDVAQAPDGMKTLADVWNFLASFTVVLNMVTCVFGAYFAMQLCSVSNTEMSRILANSSGIRVLQWFTYCSLFLILALLCIGIYMKSTPKVAWITIGVDIGFFLCCQIWFFLTLQKMFPVSGSGWTRAVGFQLPSSNVLAKHVAQFALTMSEGDLGSEAFGNRATPGVSAEGVSDVESKGDKTENVGLGDSVQDSGAGGKGKSEEDASALYQFLTDTLQKLSASKQRIHLLTSALLEEELSLAVLQEASREPMEGRKLVFEALKLDGDVRLLMGERLAIASALAQGGGSGGVHPAAYLGSTEPP